MPASHRFKITVYACKIQPMGYEYEPLSGALAGEVFEGTLPQAVARRDALGKEYATSTDTLAFIVMASRHDRKANGLGALKPLITARQPAPTGA